MHVSSILDFCGSGQRACVATATLVLSSVLFDTFTKSTGMKVSRMQIVWGPADFGDFVGGRVLDCHVAALFAGFCLV